MVGDPPAFLKNFPRFQWYREEAMAGRLRLPPYEKTAEGDVIVYPGEIFCRIPHCEKGVTPISRTTNLRHHLVNVHREKCTPRPGGLLTQEEKAQAMAWFNSLRSSAGEDNGYVDEGQATSW
ncbi:hypothetical protein N7493_002759 [Penicillium malachiteum]|uniref:Uncharacterized protein n=1 Tax=Penicillium malachiteum TaxID=1324776 RepID=A0AAD6HSG0_9EURO|nr:hypothetical protein N7493_002759 [Penicillium malachiteum]